MTFVVLVTFGMGIILVSSALDGTPVLTTFQKILTGGALDLSGTSNGTSNGAAGGATSSLPKLH